MSVSHRVFLVFAVAALAGSGLVACGDQDSAVDSADPLVQAIADQILAEEESDGTGGVFGRDRATAECFGVEVVGRIGSDRLTELGFTAGRVPAEFQTDWSVDEVDTIIDSLEACVDIATVTRTTLLAGVTQREADCILDAVGDDVLIDVLRVGLEPFPDEATSEAALEEAYGPLIAAYETCGAPLFGVDGAAIPGDREKFNDEVDGVRAVVADCFVSEASRDGRRYRTTVEVDNESGTTHRVTVTIEADLGRGGVSETFEVPSGASDAWSVVSTEETTDPVGDVECADYITAVEVTSVEP